jgi:hypothetical protein
MEEKGFVGLIVFIWVIFNKWDDNLFGGYFLSGWV